MNDNLQILELKQELTFYRARLESAQQISEYKNSEIAFLRGIVTATQKPVTAQITLNPSINVEAQSMSEKKSITEQRHINTGGGNYIESNDGGTYIQGNYSSFDNRLNIAESDILSLINRFEKTGMSSVAVQESVAKDLSTQAKNNQSLKDKLLHWTTELATSTASDVVKNVVLSAIRLAGFPLS